MPDNKKRGTRFLIAGNQRSGTTVTQQAIAGHPQIVMNPLEVAVRPFLVPGYGAFVFGNENYSSRTRAFRALFDAMARVDATEPCDTRGIKIALGSHQDVVALGNVLSEYLPGIKVIVTIREDLVAQFGSLARAEATGVWHAEKKQSSSTARIRIDAPQFTAYAEENLRIIDQLRYFGESFELLQVSYERDILGGTDWAGAFRFLGVDVVPATWLSMKKVAPDPEEYIENYAELRELLDRIRQDHRFDPAAAARADVLETARADREHQAIRRAELFACDQAPEVARSIASELLGRPELPVSTILRAMIVLAFTTNEGLPADVRQQVDEQATRLRLGNLTGDSGVAPLPTARVVALTRNMPVYEVLHLASCGSLGGQGGTAASLMCQLLESRHDLSPHQLDWALQILREESNGPDRASLRARFIEVASKHYSAQPSFAAFATDP